MLFLEILLGILVFSVLLCVAAWVWQKLGGLKGFAWALLAVGLLFGYLYFNANSEPITTRFCNDGDDLECENPHPNRDMAALSFSLVVTLLLVKGFYDWSKYQQERANNSVKE